MKFFIRAGFMALAAAAAGVTAAPASIAEGIVRLRVAGIDVTSKHTGVKDMVTIAGSIDAGPRFNPGGNPAIAALTAAMLDQGTARHDKFALARTLEDVGASTGFMATFGQVKIFARCRKKDLPLVIGVLAEQLRLPAFPAAELDKVKQREIGNIQELREGPAAYAVEAIRQSVYPPGHPNRIALDKDRMEGTRKATVEDLKAFHAAYYGPERLTLVAVGDVDTEQLHAAIEKGFSGWRRATAAPAAAPVARPQVPVQLEQTIPLPGKSSAVVYIAQATGLKYKDPDALALRVATAVLGGGMMGRLMQAVRDKEGLTYNIAARMINDNTFDGDWRIYATFAPALLEKGLASTQRQFREWYDNGITAKELAQRQKQMVGGYYISLGDTLGLSDAILDTIERGYGLSWLDEYPKAIQALTLEQVNRAIKTHLDPAKMLIVRAGSL